MSKIAGSCLCGAIRYASSAEPVMVAVCHCTHCQKQSGGAFSVNVAVPKGSLQLTAGKTTVFHDTGSSGQPVYRHFCSSCGSPIYSDVVATPQLDWLKAGTLDDTSWVRPVANIWCDSAQTWVVYPEGVPRFPQNPPTA
jgi:hypothetical protein